MFSRSHFVPFLPGARLRRETSGQPTAKRYKYDRNMVAGRHRSWKEASVRVFQNNRNAIALAIIPLTPGESCRPILNHPKSREKSFGKQGQSAGRKRFPYGKPLKTHPGCKRSDYRGGEVPTIRWVGPPSVGPSLLLCEAPGMPCSDRGGFWPWIHAPAGALHQKSKLFQKSVVTPTWMGCRCPAAPRHERR